MSSAFVWEPSEEFVERANLTRLLRRFGCAHYHELHRISVEEPARFWPEVVDDLGIAFSRPWKRVVDASRGPEWATWFDGGELNLTETCVHRWARERPDEEALVGLPEDGGRSSLTWAEASRAVRRLAEALVGLGVEPGDRVHFATDMGWIMGPWTVVGASACGATIVFAEGAPDRPEDRLWRLVESERVTMLGLSPTLVRALIPKGPPRSDTASLRAFCTTGEPWNPDPYLWLFEHVGRGRVPIVNVSGGTEVGACFLSTCILEPIKPVALGFPALGMDMDVVDARGRPVRGEVGELVCRRPWPGMTRGVWGDPERYLDTYWRRFPGIWTHGDWASIDEDGYWFLHGRSDDTLNIAGKRIGPAELESAAIGSGKVAEAAAVGVPHAVKGEVAWIFCVPQPGAEPTEAEVAAAVAEVLGKAFRPERVLFVEALPKTRSAKIVRRAVRARALGKDPGDLSSLENPEALEQIARAI